MRHGTPHYRYAPAVDGGWCSPPHSSSIPLPLPSVSSLSPAFLCPSPPAVSVLVLVSSSCVPCPIDLLHLCALVRHSYFCSAMSAIPSTVSLSSAGTHVRVAVEAPLPAGVSHSQPVEGDQSGVRRSLTRENWVLNHQSGTTRLAEDTVRLAAALEDFRSLEDALESFQKRDLRNAASLLGLELGRDKKVHKTEVVQRLREHARQRRNQLSGAGAGSPHSSDEDDSDEDEQSEEELEVTVLPRPEEDDEQKEESDEPRTPPPQSSRGTALAPHTDPLPSPRSRSVRHEHSIAQQAQQQDMQTAEYEIILSYLARSSRVSQKKLDRLSAAGRCMYEGLWRAEQARAAPPQSATTPRVSFTVSQPTSSAVGVAQTPTMSPLTGRGRPTPTPSKTPLTPSVARQLLMSHSPATLYGDSDAELDDGIAVDDEEEKDPVQSRGNSAARREAMLQRQGVPAGRLCALDAVQAARVEVGGGSFEQWWLARSSHIKYVSVASYYEGLLLALLLDHRDDPAVWMELAARRWLTLNLVVNHNFQWQQARSLLPLSGVSCMGTDIVYEMQRYSKTQQDLFPTPTRFAYSGRGKGDSKPAGGAKGGQKDKRGGSGGGSNAGATGVAAASGIGGGSTQRRNSTGGAGASSTAGAGQR